MSARHKLNSATMIGVLVVASVAGAISESWAAFWLTAVVLIGMAVHAGNIRLTGRRS